MGRVGWLAGMTGPDLPSQVLVLFGATGDLAKRKRFPGLFFLSRDGLLPASTYVRTSA
ncbi:hypothetical protein GCM10023215_63290 [Pseudonocardia yuanmonensis]|uniref:Glucose-6-phosphate dehydrogenase NAD-binding domain-containing protein n=1 Tax=Pseudonocardia yuanmonensis TaxID=1095914 RepID=A0ABP8XR23_9PSEU